MNILQQEDMVKGLPDEALMQEAEQPSGQLPQYLLISEVQRRADMRKRYQQQMQEAEPTVAEQVLQEGIAGLAPPPEPMQQAMNGGQPPMQPPMNGAPQQMPPGMPLQMNGAPQQMPPGMNGGFPPQFETQMAYQGGVVRMNEGSTVEPPRMLPLMNEEEKKKKIAEAIALGATVEQIGSLSRGAFRPTLIAMGYDLTPDDSISAGEMASIDAARDNLVTEMPPQIGAVAEIGQSNQYEPGPYAKTYKEFLERWESRPGAPTPREIDLGEIPLDWLSRGGRGSYASLGSMFDPSRVKGLIATAEAAVDPSFVVAAEQPKIGGNLVDTGGNPKGAIIEDALSLIDTSSFPKRRGKPETLSSEFTQLKGASEESISLDEQRANIAKQNALRDEMLKEEAAGENGAPVLTENDIAQLISGNPDSQDMTLLAPEILAAQEEDRQQNAANVAIANKRKMAAAKADEDKEISRSSLLKALGALKNRKSSIVDYSELIKSGDEQARQDAFSQMLVNLGAGIAAGDMAQGLRDAGEAVAKTRGKQRELRQAMELAQLKGASEAEKADLAMELSIIEAQLGGLPPAAAAITPSELQKTLADMNILKSRNEENTDHYKYLESRVATLTNPSVQNVVGPVLIKMKEVGMDGLDKGEKDIVNKYFSANDLELILETLRNQPREDESDGGLLAGLAPAQASGGLVKAADGVYRSAG